MMEAIEKVARFDSQKNAVQPGSEDGAGRQGIAVCGPGFRAVAGMVSSFCRVPEATVKNCSK